MAEDPTWIDILWFVPWWQRGGDGWFDLIYPAFNLAEATCWMVCAGFVLYRWWRSGRSRWLEPGYAAALVTFGVTDLLESQSISGWLVAAKIGNALLLWWLRRRTLALFPGARLL
ncbi:hypothetical protein LBMAG53_39920 [Planctomycetota bacterium]|nr:hypothetical protein LBMAG53_39920 [Planctomycetota bacterium]